MLELFSSGLISLWLEMAGASPKASGVTAAAQPAAAGNPVGDSVDLVAWQADPWRLLTGAPDPSTENAVEQYLKGLAAKGWTTANQGIWIQSGPLPLANHQGTTPLPAASLTKIATSLAALETWGPTHQFETLIGATGPIQNGVLQGDLVIYGTGDPFFVWEEAIAVGNSLNQMGISRVTGNLIITGSFAMNYESDPTLAGTLLKQGLNSAIWPEEAKAQYLTLPKGTPQPKVAIDGAVQVGADGRTPALLIPRQIVLLRHQSLPLAQILKHMNIYSNNLMAEMLASSVGGAQVVAQKAAAAAGVPPEEIQLINGSGLGPENRLSPRAVYGMLMAIQRYLQPHHITIADLFPVSGRDQGTLIDRRIPPASVVKTGTLWDVSALAGVMPTRDRGLVWFVIINRGEDVEGLRAQQDTLLQTLVNQWGMAPTLPIAIAPTPGINNELVTLGAAMRNQILYNQNSRG